MENIKKKSWLVKKNSSSAKKIQVDGKYGRV